MLEDFCPLSIRVAVPPRRYSDSGSETAVRNKQDDSELDARIRSYELAYPMQSSASEAVDLRGRRSIQRIRSDQKAVWNGRGRHVGVRNQLPEAAGTPHKDIEGNHTKWCRSSDKPIAGLLTDLKARGMPKDRFGGGVRAYTFSTKAGDCMDGRRRSRRSIRARSRPPCDDSSYARINSLSVVVYRA